MAILTLRAKALVVPPVGPIPGGAAASSTSPGDEVSYPKAGGASKGKCEAASSNGTDDRPPLQRRKRGAHSSPKEKEDQEEEGTRITEVVHFACHASDESYDHVAYRDTRVTYDGPDGYSIGEEHQSAALQAADMPEHSK